MIVTAAGLIVLFLIAMGVSQRFRALVVRRRWGFAAVLLGLIGVIVFTFVATDYFSVDACLDSGGRWDKEREVCQHKEPSVP